ncbi:MAG: sulfoxide reductase heme-binding subunit YedZ [Amphritea sp.]|nr:sulfoxide reductase heme-binding subunit YedZ [Amphritea sp.]
MVLSGVKPFSVIRWWTLFLLLLVPLLLLIRDIIENNLGADPARTVVTELGFWAMTWLWLTLAVTPLRKQFNWSWLMRFRRMFGLYAFFYAALHLLAFTAFLIEWRLDLLVRELTKRPYIIVGTIALLLLLPLAVTSTRAMQRKLGKRWLQLHRLIYPASLLVLLHFIWQIRSDFGQHLFFALLLAIMLGYRLYLKKRG